MNVQPDDATQMIYAILLERFGEPISKTAQTVGISDDRSGKITTHGENEEETEDDLLLDEVAGSPFLQARAIFS